MTLHSAKRVRDAAVARPSFDRREAVAVTESLRCRPVRRCAGGAVTEPGSGVAGFSRSRVPAGRAASHSEPNSKLQVPTLYLRPCEPVWPSGKALGW